MAGTCFVPGRDFIGSDDHPNDDNAHGTHVAGTIAGTTNNGLGVAGLAHDACVMPIKVLDHTGTGPYSAIIDGIYYATDHGADVINMSLSGTANSMALANALEYAHDNGVIVVASAGNYGGTSKVYPAGYDDWVIAVGATRYDDALTDYSNYGSHIDLVAPGGDVSVDQSGDGYGDGILQNTLNPNTRNACDLGYWFFEGTSMAAPHVSALAAMVISNGNATTPDDVRCVLEGTALDLGASGRDDVFGWGLIDAAEALTASCSDNPPDGSLTVFYDSFENGAWNGLWSEDSQNDWRVSTQRATSGRYSAEVDGRATDAALISKTIELTGGSEAAISFNWYIERGVDRNEYLAFDVSTDGGLSWTEKARLRGNEDAENVWHSERIDLDVSGATGLQLRFRGRMSGSSEDANVDEVKVTVTSGTGGPGQAPVASFSYDCAYLDCEFRDSSTADGGRIVTRAWEFGDGGTSSSINPTHNYFEAGTYTVTLTVIDEDGGTDAISRDVTVTAPNALPIAGFSVSTSGLTASFSDTSSDSDGSIVNWSWDFGDGNGSTDRNPSHTYAAAGTYSVALTATDNDGGTASVTDTVTIDVSGNGSTEVFNDSFENRAWNGLWSEDSQNDWRVSTQRATSGRYSAEVDGRATDAALISKTIDLMGGSEATISFNWYIERRVDINEYVAFDVSTNGGSSWTEKARLRGNVDAEDTWHSEQVDLNVSGVSGLLLRFRGRMSSSSEDANVDEVIVTVR
jgi:serine protease